MRVRPRVLWNMVRLSIRTKRKLPRGPVQEACDGGEACAEIVTCFVPVQTQMAVHCGLLPSRHRLKLLCGRHLTLLSTLYFAFPRLLLGYSSL